MKRFLLFLGDIITLYAALSLVVAIRYYSKFAELFGLHIPSFTLIFIIWLLMFYIANLYDLNRTKNGTRFYTSFLYALLINAIISIVFFYLIPLFGIAPKTNLFLFLIFYLVIGFAWRWLFNALISKGKKDNVLFIGENEQAEELKSILLSNPQLGLNPLAVIDLTGERIHESLERVIAESNTKIIVLSPETYRVPHIIDVFYRLIGLNLRFYSTSDFYELVTGKIPLGAIDQTWFLDNLSEGTKRGYEVSKRVFDVMMSLVIGCISLIFYPLIITAIKIDSRGPALFRQRRVGKAGKIFTLVKFRTLVANAPDGSAEGKSGPAWASANDSRVTRVGKFIRKTRIDELPQVWNVLKGEMSFIGPRPERPEFHDELKTGVPFYEERYLIKPGLTGWAQLKYKLDFKGGMTIRDTFEKLQYDLYYIKHRSPFLDLAIVLKTIGKLLLQEGK